MPDYRNGTLPLIRSGTDTLELSIMVAVTRRYLLIFSLSTVWALGQTKKPNFSGRWRMVKGKSEFRGFKTPDIIVRSVEHRDPTLNLHTVQTTGTKTAISDISYFTDGATAN